jgi:hypothetical protein
LLIVSLSVDLKWTLFFILAEWNQEKRD